VPPDRMKLLILWPLAIVLVVWFILVAAYAILRCVWELIPAALDR
jgi:hypothetical protein